MLSLCCSWLLRGAAPRLRRAPSQPLRVEALEDRLAPAGLPALDLAGLVLVAREIHHPNREVRNETPFRISGAARDGAGHHPFLAALAIHFLSLKFDPAPLRSTLSDQTAGLSLLSLAQGQNALLTGMLPPVEKPVNPNVSFAAASLLVPSRQSLALSGLLPFPADLPSFAPANPSTPKAANPEGPLTFELSPFAPFGLGIVPIPVPRGLEEGLADLFGNPTPPSRPVEGLLAPSNSGDPDAVRAAVQQMLQENATALGPGGPIPLTAVRPAEAPVPRSGTRKEGRPTNALPDGTITAGTPLDPADEAEGEKPLRPSPARSVLALWAAGIGLFLRHLHPVALRPLLLPARCRSDPSREKLCP